MNALDTPNAMLRGRRVLVTGGGSGIGRGVALAFGQSGAQVALTYHASAQGASETVEAIRAAGGEAFALQADLTAEAEVQRVVETVEAQFGGINVLVVNVGGLLKCVPVVECSRSLWDEALAVNLTSTFLCCRAVIPSMARARQGCIITMTSLAAHDSGGQGASHYAAAKGGVLTFTRALAKELGPVGIRVNGIAPGLIATQFHDRLTTNEARQATVKRTPLGREGLPEDVAGAALFLSSPYAAFITGEIIEVNGGQGMY
jgi:3-oxoacyl-[acyl-carrier protein] reductase